MNNLTNQPTTITVEGTDFNLTPITVHAPWETVIGFEIHTTDGAHLTDVYKHDHSQATNPNEKDLMKVVKDEILSHSTKPATTITMIEPNGHHTEAFDRDPDQYIKDGGKTHHMVVGDYNLLVFTRHGSLEDANDYAQQLNTQQFIR